MKQQSHQPIYRYGLLTLAGLIYDVIVECSTSVTAIGLHMGPNNLRCVTLSLHFLVFSCVGHVTFYKSSTSLSTVYKGYNF